MSKTLTTANIKESVAFSVIAKDGGKVGIKNTSPEDRFVVSQPLRRDITAIGSNFTKTGVSAADFEFFYYKEGSRVYLQGKLNLASSQTYTVNGSMPIVQLPINYRPLKNQRFVATCYFFTNGGTREFRNCVLYARPNGEIGIQYLGVGEVSTLFQGVTDPSPAAPLSFFITFDNISFIAEQPV